ncbi:MAG: hypothetical protein R3B70_39535 [Polyangiaceae bacterium]
MRISPSTVKGRPIAQPAPWHDQVVSPYGATHSVPPSQSAATRQMSVSSRQTRFVTQPQPSLYEETPHSPLAQSSFVRHSEAEHCAHGRSVGTTPGQMHAWPALQSESSVHG